MAEKFASENVPFVTGTSARDPRFRHPTSMPKPACCRSRPPRPIRSSPNAGCGTCSASAAVTTSRARLPAEYIAKHYKGKKIAILQDKSTYGKGLADQTKKAIDKAGMKEKMYEAYTVGEKDFTALVSKMKAAIDRRRLCRRLSHRSRPDPAPDARPGHEGADDLGRRHRHRRVLVDHRRRRRRHAVHLRPRSAQAPDRRRRREVQGQGHRSGRLHALHLRRRAGMAEAAKKAKTTDPKKVAARSRPASGTPCSARSPTTRRATSPRSTTCCTAGRRTAGKIDLGRK